jgi:hypothetical protein
MVLIAIRKPTCPKHSHSLFLQPLGFASPAKITAGDESPMNYSAKCLQPRLLPASTQAASVIASASREARR